MPPVFPLVDPAPLGDLISRLIETMLQQSAGGFNWRIEYYFRWTGNVHGADGGPFAYAQTAWRVTGNDGARALCRQTGAARGTVEVRPVVELDGLPR